MEKWLIKVIAPNGSELVSMELNEEPSWEFENYVDGTKKRRKTYSN